LFFSVMALKAQNSFYAAFVGDTITLYVETINGSVQWQETTDTTQSWTDIFNAYDNPYNYKITAIGTGFKYFRAKITNPEICPTAPYYGSIIKCRIVYSVSQIQTGDIYAGGYVFYKNGNSGLVTATVDQGSAAWGCSGTDLTGAAGLNVGTGYQNTVDILAGCVEEGIAAYICDTLTLNGYNDWFLPSLNELNSNQALYTNGTIPNFSNTAYWTSSEVTATTAKAYSFAGATMTYNGTKTTSLRVRAIRSFYVLNVQQRLNALETPKHIFDSGMPIDSLYGKTYAGGLIFYLNTGTGAGMVAAPTDQANAPAGNVGIMISCSSTCVGCGPANTICYDNATADGSASYNCANLTLNGYDDWFLPSSGELLLMYSNLDAKGYGSFAPNNYWSSSNSSYNNTYKVSFGSSGMYEGQAVGLGGDYSCNVRAARLFSN